MTDDGSYVTNARKVRSSAHRKKVRYLAVLDRVRKRHEGRPVQPPFEVRKHEGEKFEELVGVAIALASRTSLRFFNVPLSIRHSKVLDKVRLPEH